MLGNQCCTQKKSLKSSKNWSRKKHFKINLVNSNNKNTNYRVTNKKRFAREKW